MVQARLDHFSFICIFSSVVATRLVSMAVELVSVEVLETYSHQRNAVSAKEHDFNVI